MALVVLKLDKLLDHSLTYAFALGMEADDPAFCAVKGVVLLEV